MPLAQSPFRPRSFAKKPILHHAVFHKHLSDRGCVGDKSAETQRRNQPSLTEAASPTQGALLGGGWIVSEQQGHRLHARMDAKLA
jgi:hypothetical protein